MQTEHLQTMVTELLAAACQQGAEQAEAAVYIEQNLSVTARLRTIETIEHTHTNSLGVTVYRGHSKGSATTTDFSPQAIQDTVTAACQIARHTAADPAAGLAESTRMATQIPDLDLNHPWELSPTQATQIAQECEEAALAYDPRITNSEGASLHTGYSRFIYGNSHGFIGGYPSTRHSLSCAVVAEKDTQMQRDYWYSTARLPSALQTATEVGIQAAQRCLARLGSHKIPTTSCPVVFQADLAAGLLRSLCSAIQGSALYRQASFMLDTLGQTIFPTWAQITENPLLPRGLASAPFDAEGVATQHQQLVTDGVLQSYILDSYSGRKLNMPTTGNAGGVRNLHIQNTGQDFATLVRHMHQGLVITELMGQGVNPVTGDYSRGAAGFWVERGEIQHPVAEITIAGNLRDMFTGLQAVGTDNHYPGSTNTGSWLIDQMAVAGV